MNKNIDIFNKISKDLEIYNIYEDREELYLLSKLLKENVNKNNTKIFIHLSPDEEVEDTKDLLDLVVGLAKDLIKDTVEDRLSFKIDPEDKRIQEYVNKVHFICWESPAYEGDLPIPDVISYHNMKRRLAYLQNIK